MRNAIVAAVIATVGFSTASFAQDLTVGVSWSNFQEERWKTDEAAIIAAWKPPAPPIVGRRAVSAAKQLADMNR